MSVQKKRAVAVVSASVIMAALRALIVHLFMEKNAHSAETYSLPSNGAVIGFAAAAVLFVAVFALLAAKFGRKKTVSFGSDSLSVSVGSLVLGFTLIAEVIVCLQSLFQNEVSSVSLAVAIIFLSLVCAVIFLLNVSDSLSKRLSGNTRAALAILPILLTAIRLLGDFIRTNVMPFESSGAYHLISLVAVLLYFLCEGKSHSGSGSAGICLFFGFSAIFFLLIYAVPNIANFCFGNFDFDYYSGFSLVDIATAVYIACRISNCKISASQSIEIRTRL